MRISRKVNLMLLLTLFAMCISIFHPMTVNAADNAPGGSGNTVTVNSSRIKNSDFGNRQNYHVTLTAKEGYEIIGYLSDGGDYVSLSLVLYDIKSRTYRNIANTYSIENLSDYVGTYLVYEEGKLKRSTLYSLGSGTLVDTFWYRNNGVGIRTYDYSGSVSGCKVFIGKQEMDAYVKSGSLDGMISQDDVEDGDYDPEIGYLHDLKKEGLLYGEQDENGLYSNNDDRFTWSDYYPEYDDSYLVEVRASCEVNVSKWFGVGKSTVYNSDVREISTGTRYKDLEYIVGMWELKSVFADFINQHMPGNTSVGDVTSAAYYDIDAYYFRIYRWDEETQSYKYGMWVRLDMVTGSTKFVTDAGFFDKNGNWKQNPDSDYGEGKKGSTLVGAGDDLDSALDDVKKEAEKAVDKTIDLSDTNFKELWEWFVGVLIDFWNGLGVIPDFFARLFSFLPAPVIALIAGSIVVALVLRILGR